MENTMISDLTFKSESNNLKSITLCEENLTDAALVVIAGSCSKLQFVELEGKTFKHSKIYVLIS